MQRRYAVRIRPIRSMGLVNFGWIFELFIELYRICAHFSYIEYVSRIHLVKMIRRAVVSRVIRVQRRYAVQIRPIRSGGLVNFGWIFELFIELYRICTHFSYIEYVLVIHLVKISLIFIKYEPSTERSKGLGHGRIFGSIRGEQSLFFMNLKTTRGT